MKYTIALVSILAVTPALADNKFEAELNVSQDKGAQGHGVLKWRVPVEGMLYRWGPTVSFGITENNKTKDTETLESEHFYSAAAGLSFVIRNPSSPLALFNDLSFGLDGINLKTSKNQTARHALVTINSGLRIEDPNGAFVQLGVSMKNRDLSTSKIVLVNDVRLTKYSVSPMMGFGTEF